MLQKSVFLLGFEKNVYKYLNNAKCLILTSLYENPGHVLIEQQHAIVLLFHLIAPQDLGKFYWMVKQDFYLK